MLAGPVQSGVHSRERSGDRTADGPWSIGDDGGALSARAGLVRADESAGWGPGTFVLPLQEIMSTRCVVGLPLESMVERV